MPSSSTAAMPRSEYHHGQHDGNHGQQHGRNLGNQFDDHYLYDLRVREPLGISNLNGHIVRPSCRKLMVLGLDCPPACVVCPIALPMPVHLKRIDGILEVP